MAAKYNVWFLPLVLLTVWTAFAEDNTTNVTTAAATDTAECMVGDEVQAIWEGDGKMYRAVIHSMNNDGTITVDWDDGDSTFRTMAADKVQKVGFICQPSFEDKRDTGAVVLCMILTIVAIVACGVLIWFVDGKMRQMRDGNKVTPVISEDKLQSWEEEQTSKVTDSTPAPSLADSAPKSVPALAPIAAASPDMTTAPPLETTSLDTEHLEEPPPASSQAQAPPEVEAAILPDAEESAVPPEPMAVASPAPAASAAMEEARCGGPAAPDPLETSTPVQVPTKVFATAPPVTEADMKVLSEWNDDIAEEPLSDSDHETTAAQSEESV